MKKIILLYFGVLASNFVWSQQGPTGPAINPNSPTPPLAASAWYRGGNSPGNTGGFKNIFGTLWNSPIYTYTNGVNRMKINGDGTNYNGVNTSGYIGIGADPTDVRSRLTITGENNAVPFAGEGYRAWMKTGVFNLENSENLCMELKV